LSDTIHVISNYYRLTFCVTVHTVGKCGGGGHLIRLVTCCPLASYLQLSEQ